MKSKLSIWIVCLLMLPIVAFAEGEPKKLYSHQSGGWSDFNTWTEDPSGISFDNVSHDYPGKIAGTDYVIEIIAGATVTLDNAEDVVVCAELINNGILKLNEQTTHHVEGAIKGSGRIVMKIDNFPSCLNNDFITDGGTAVFTSTTPITLASNYEYSNLEINAATVIFAADITCHGSLSVVNGGHLKLNAPISVEKPRNEVRVEDEFVVNNGCSVEVVDGSNPFDIFLYGDMKNDGEVHLSTLTQYSTTELQNSYANVHFVSAKQNQTVYCDSYTNFYRIYMDKGNDATFVLKFTAYNRDKFNVFAPAESDGQDNLILTNGTLEIGSNIYFPFLNRVKYTIPSSVTLLVDAGKVNTDSDVKSSIAVYGKISVQGSGELNVYNPDYGITLYDQGILEISDGVINTTRIVTGGGVLDYGSYYQTGGTVNVNNTSHNGYDFSLGNTNSGFYISDGVLNIAHGGIQILSGDGKYTVVGGVVNLDAENGTVIDINSNSSFPTLNVKSSTGSSVTVLLNDKVLRVVDNLSVGESVSLSTSKDVYIGGNLNVAGSFTCNGNTTEFNSSKNSELTLPIGFQFVNLTINKSDNDKTVTTSTPFSVTNDLNVQKGTFVNGNNDILIAHDIIMGDDTKILSGSGNIVLKEKVEHTLHSELRAPAIFGNIYYVGGEDNVHDLKLDGPVVAKDFKFGDGAKLVELNGHYVEVTGKLQLASSTQYFINNGKVSGGLRLHFTLKKGENKTIDFPIGDRLCEKDGNNCVDNYTPAHIVVNGGSFSQDYTGSVRVNVVGKSHPNLLSENNMKRYWVVDQNGFDNVPANTVQYNFDSHGTIPEELVSEGLVAFRGWKKSDIQNISGKIFSFKNSEYGMLSGDFTCALENDFVIKMWRTNPTWIPSKDGFKFQQSDAHWHNGSIWVRIDENGQLLRDGNNKLVTGSPGSNDIVYVYFNRVSVNSNVTVGQIVFVDGDPLTEVNGVIVPDAYEYEIDDLEHTPRVMVSEGRKLNVGRVSGEGVIGQFIREPRTDGKYKEYKDQLNIQDMSEFAKEPNSWILYKADGETINGLDLYPEIPNLALEAGTFKFQQNLNVNFDLNMRGGATILLSSDSPQEDIYVGRDLYIGDFEGAVISYNATGYPHNIVVKGNLSLTATNGNSTAYNGNIRTINIAGDCAANTLLEHRLVVGGDIITGTGSKKSFNLYSTKNNGVTGVVLELNGSADGKIIETDHTYANTTAATLNLWKIVMNKTAGASFTINRDFELKSAVDAYAGGTLKPITMISGHLIINNTLKGNDNKTKTYILSNGGGDFVIGTDAVLTTTGNKAKYKVKNSGITLFGGLNIGNGSEWTVDNSIEYSESGKSEISISNATLTVGQQIRPPVSAGGSLVLSLKDATSVLNVGANSVEANGRGILELVNMSKLNMADGATINIKSRIANSTVPDINISPVKATISPSASIVVATGTTEPATILSTVEIPSLVVKNVGNKGSVLKMMSNDLTVTGLLNIENKSKFITDGYKLYLKGGMDCQGNFDHCNNTTFVCGTGNQSIIGNVTFYNLTKNTESDVTFNGQTTILNDANFLAGKFRGNSITAKGNVVNNALYYCENFNDHATGFIFGGTALQTILSDGNGVFEKIRLNNPAGVKLPTGNSFTISKMFQLDQGTFDLGTCTITMTENAVFSGNYSVNNMIKVTDAYATGGVRKVFPKIESNTSFVLPIGTTDKYTPVSINVDNINVGASITIRPINDGPNCIEKSKWGSILNYYWTLYAENVSSFTGNIVFEHVPTDAKVSGDCNLSKYVTAIQLSKDTKFKKTTGYDEANSTLTFNFEAVSSEDLTGKYLAGCNDAIPEELPVYVTAKDGVWFPDENHPESIWRIYDPVHDQAGDVPVDAPVNSIVYIKHNVTINQDMVSCFETHILADASLDQVETQHNALGEVFGCGTLKSSTGDLPSGVYDDFLAQGHGTLHYYGGATKSYSILKQLPLVNNVIIEGDGIKDFPNMNVQILGYLHINGNVDNSANSIIYLKGDLWYEDGKFITGNLGKSKFVFNGDDKQRVYGSDFSATNCIFNMVIDNAMGVTLENNVFVKNEIEFVRGVVNTQHERGMLTMDNSNPKAVKGYSPTKYVDGPFCKRINEGEQYTFPIGNYNEFRGGDRYGELTIQNTETNGTAYWTAQYYNETPNNWDSFDNMLLAVSSNEYWSIYSEKPNYKARIVTRWDDFSEVTENFKEGNIRQVHYNSANNEWNISGTKPHQLAEDENKGYIASDQVIAINPTKDTPDYFTFGFATEFNYSWIGSDNPETGRSWFVKENWAMGYIPTVNTNVKIGGDPKKWPLIDRTDKLAVCKSLILEPNTILDIASNASLTVSTDVNIDETAKLTLLAPTSASDYDAKGRGHSIAKAGSLIYHKLEGKVTFQRFVRGYEWERLCVPVVGYNPTPLKSCGSWYLYSYNEAFDLDKKPGYVFKDGENEDMNSAILSSAWSYIAGPTPSDLSVPYRYICSKKTGPHVMSFSGTPLQNTDEQQTVKLNFTDNDLYSAPNGEPSHMLDGWNLVANPYLSAIDANMLDFANCDRVVYIHDNIDNASFAYAIASEEYVGVKTGFNCRYIPAGQSFFVHASENAAGNNGSITFSHDCLTHGDPDDVNSTVIKSGHISTSGDDGVEKLLFTTSGNGVEYSSVVFFASGATEKFDSDFDAYMQASKLQNLMMFYSFGSDKSMPLAANGLPFDIKNGGEVALGYIANTSGTYTLTLNKFTVKDAIVYLYDAQKGTTTELSQGFSCKVDVEKGTNDSRFKLIFRVNHAPVIKANIAHVFVDAGMSVEQSVKGVFTENDKDDYIAEIEATAANGGVLPSWLDFDYDSGTFIGSPTYDDMGEYDIEVTASDSYGAKTSCKFTITVVNPADPRGAIGNVSTQSGKFSLDIPEGTFTGFLGDKLMYAYTLADGSPLPEFLSYNPEDGSLSCNTDKSQNIRLILTVCDLYGNTLIDKFTITISIPQPIIEPSLPIIDPVIPIVDIVEPVVIEQPVTPIDDDPAGPVVVEPVVSITEPVTPVVTIIDEDPVTPETPITEPSVTEPVVVINPPTEVAEPEKPVTNPPAEVEEPVVVTNPPAEVAEPEKPVTNPPAEVEEPVVVTNPPAEVTEPEKLVTNPPAEVVELEKPVINRPAEIVEPTDPSLPIIRPIYPEYVEPTVEFIIPEIPHSDIVQPIVEEKPFVGPAASDEIEEVEDITEQIESIVPQPYNEGAAEKKIMVRVYPVPSNGRVTIEMGTMTDETGSVQMFLVSSTGRVVAKKSISSNTYELNLTGRPGVYILRLQTPSKTIVKRILIQ